MAAAARAPRAALLGLRAACAPGASPVARARPLQLLPSRRPVRTPLPAAFPGAPGARGPAAARAGAAGSAGGPPARGLGPGVTPAPRVSAQLGGRSLHSAQFWARPVCPPGLRALDTGAVHAAAVLPRGLPGGAVGRAPRLAARTAHLPPRPCPPAALLGGCLLSPPTLCRPRPLAPRGLGASGAQGQDPGAEPRIQQQWGTGKGQQGGLWDARLSTALHLEADLQLGVRSVRAQVLWFLFSWILCLALPAVRGQVVSGFLGFCLEIQPSDRWYLHGQLGDLSGRSPVAGWASAIFLCKSLPAWPGVIRGAVVSPSPAVSWSLVVAAGGLVWEACRLELGVGAGLSWFLFHLAGVFFSPSAGTLNQPFTTHWP